MEIYVNVKQDGYPQMNIGDVLETLYHLRGDDVVYVELEEDY